MKIIDKINKVNGEGSTTVSFEFFPAKVGHGPHAAARPRSAALTRAHADGGRRG